MAFDVSGLSNYTNENVDDLIAASHFDNKTYNYLTSKGAKVQTGIKTTEKITLIDEDILFQADSGCGFNASGGSTISQRSITVGAIKVNKSYCPKDLKAKKTQYLLKPGSMAENDDDAAWVKPFVDENVAGISENMEKAWWQGDTTVYDVNLNKFDGLLKNTVTGSVAANALAYYGTPLVAATGYTESNARAVVKAVKKALPEGVKGKLDVVFACGTDFFDTYIDALEAANLFHYSPDHENYEIKIPGTAYKLVGFPGLSGTNKVLAFRASNVRFGADLEHEEEEFAMKYNEHDETVRFKAAWKAGVNVAYPSEVVRFDLA